MLNSKLISIIDRLAILFAVLRASAAKSFNFDRARHRYYSSFVVYMLLMFINSLFKLIKIFFYLFTLIFSIFKI